VYLFSRRRRLHASHVNLCIIKMFRI
jgi:hypothetical protein